MCEGKRRLTGQGIVIQSHFPRGPTQARGQGNQDSAGWELAPSWLKLDKAPLAPLPNVEKRYLIAVKHK